MSEQSSSHKQGAQSPLCLWHSMVRAAGNFPALFTSASMQNIFNKLSLHGKCSQNAFSAHCIHRLFHGFSCFSSPHSPAVPAVLPRLWHCSWVFFQPLFCPLPFSYSIFSAPVSPLTLIAVTCAALDPYPLINPQFRMFTVLFQWRQGYPVPRKQQLFIPLDAACIAIFQNNFNLCCISLSGCLKKK